jgi:hypothetical protein
MLGWWHWPLLAIGYLLFPTVNPSGDALSYAASLRWGFADVWNPHHLLFNLPAWALLKLFDGIGVGLDVLAFCHFLAGIYGLLMLLALEANLRLLKTDPAVRPWLVLLAGVSFGCWRFAVEYETYLLPNALALVATYHWLAYVLRGAKPIRVWYSGLFIALACLAHQLMIFWAIGLAFGWLLLAPGKRGLIALRYALPGLILLPLSYLLVLSIHSKEQLSFQYFWAFLTHAYQTGSATWLPDVKSLVLIPVTLIRSCIEIKGFFYLRPMQYSLFPGYIIFYGSCFGVIYILNSIFKGLFWTLYECLRHWNSLNLVFVVMLWLHVCFAIWSSANAEFLSMVPVLLVLLLAEWPAERDESLSSLTIGILLFNLCTAILPNHLTSKSPNSAYYGWQKKHPSDLLLLHTHSYFHYSNYVRYQTGTEPKHAVDIGDTSPNRLPARFACLACDIQPQFDRASITEKEQRLAFCSQLKQYRLIQQDTLDEQTILAVYER